MTQETCFDEGRILQVLAFLQAAEQLKDTLRSGTTSSGRPESTAEHTWRLCLMAMMFNREMGDCDRLKLMKLCIVHDLGEAISGDVPAPKQSADDGRRDRERNDFIDLSAPLPDDLRQELLDLWDDYSTATSPEAILAKGFDKLETMMQHLIGQNAPDFDYEFNLTYGRIYTDRHPLLRHLRAAIDRETSERLAARQSIPER